MTIRSKAVLLLAAALATVHGEPSPPIAIDPQDGSTTSSLNGGVSAISLNGIVVGDKELSTIEFLQNNSPTLILATTFPTPELHSAFDAWKDKASRTYETLHEHALRKLIWLSNHAHIESHNADKESGKSDHTYTLAHNDFSDITNDEFKQRFYLGEYSPGVKKPKGRSDGSWFGGGAASTTQRKLLRSDEDVVYGAIGEDDADEATVVDVPDFKNWTADGAVTKVKNQWFCGACWAFSAVGAIEGARAIKTGNLTELSMQQLIDCDMTDLGCGGGLMDQAFQYDEDSVGLCALEEYPFAFHRHWFYGCRRYMPYCEPMPNSKVKKFVDVEKNSTESLKAAIATQPVSVAVTATSDWQFYHKGVFNKGCDGPETIDHGVLAVGYGHYDPATDPDATAGDKAGDYWLIKNSWGGWWGESGYIKLARGAGHEADGGSSCILTLASRPLLVVDN